MERLTNGAKFAEYRLIKCVGKGAFGSVWSAQKDGSETDYAIKVEDPKVAKSIIHEEAEIAEIVSKSSAFPKYFGKGEFSGLKYYVIELLGLSVRTFQENHPAGILPLSEVGRLGVCLLRAIRDFHNFGFVHRDIKPSNFVFRDHPSNLDICLIDFGLAKRWRSLDGTEIYPQREKVGFRGTSRYASLNSHKELDLGRRDDLYSLFYLLIEFTAPPLPWKNQSEKNSIAQIKQRGVSRLCVGLPPQFESFYNHISSLQFADDPDYEYLEKILGDIKELGDVEGGGSQFGVSLAAQFGSMSLIVAPNSGSVIGSSTIAECSWGAVVVPNEINETDNPTQHQHYPQSNNADKGCCIIL